ncbi:MAG: DNA repair protein RecN, partial [Thermodesulfobacteriota bacterium]
LGIDLSDNQLIIKRVVNLNGKNKTYLNNSICSTGVLQNITEGLVSIFGQLEHQDLLKKNNHLNYLDEYSQLEHELLKYRNSYKELSVSKKEYEKLLASESVKTEKEEFLKFELREINSVNIKTGEDEELEIEQTVLSNSENFSFSLSNAYRLLYETDNAVFVNLKQTANHIESVSKLDGSIGEVKKRIESILLEIEDISFSIREFSENVRHDPDRLEAVINRLNEINRLKRKYAASVEGIIQKQKKIEDEIRNFENSGELLKKLEKQISEQIKSTNNVALNISEKRKENFLKLKQIFYNEAETVGMKGAFIEAEFDIKEISADGIDKLNILFSANPDQEPKPLEKVASGGELSRIMLILKGFVSDKNKGSILIFDEADTGIGGYVAETIGKKIKKLSYNNQVLCITHLPQIAKFADNHLVVTKMIKSGRTEVSVKKLDKDGRIQEIGRMLSGEKITKNVIEVAKELISGAN